MKKKVIALLLGTALCATVLTACGSAKPLESPIILDEEVEQSTEVENAENDQSDDLKAEKDEVVDNETEKEDTKEDGADKSDSVSDNDSKEDSDVESTDNVDSKDEKTDDKEDEEEKEVDPYAGLAVAKCHSVTLPMGTSYNDAIAEIIKGTSAYPDTYPNISMANLEVPGVYSCYWEQKQADGTWLPLNYAVFTVTIYDPNPVVTPPAAQ